MLGGPRQPRLRASIGWTAAHSWTTNSSSPTKLGVVDPANNFLREVHQYLDGDSSGTSAACVGATIGSERLVDLTKWVSYHDVRAFLGR